MALEAAVAAHEGNHILWDSLHALELLPTAYQLEAQGAPDSESLVRRTGAWNLYRDRIRNKQWSFSTDPKTGRVFNNLTSLPRTLRRYALLHGRPCVEIDVCSSQPFLLAWLYAGDSAEKAKYLELVCCGDFYEALGEASGVKWKSRGRAWLKVQVYQQVLFGPVRRVFPMWRAFCLLFPELATLIGQKKDGHYNRLSLELQAVEASLMVRQVVPRLHAALAGVPMLTIHDSLLIPEAYGEQAASMIASLFCAEIGRPPRLRVIPPAEAKH